MRIAVALLLMMTPAAAQQMTPSQIAVAVSTAVNQMATALEQLEKQNQELKKENEELKKQVPGK